MASNTYGANAQLLSEMYGATSAKVVNEAKQVSAGRSQGNPSDRNQADRFSANDYHRGDPVSSAFQTN